MSEPKVMRWGWDALTGYFEETVGGNARLVARVKLLEAALEGNSDRCVQYVKEAQAESAKLQARVEDLTIEMEHERAGRKEMQARVEELQAGVEDDERRNVLPFNDATDSENAKLRVANRRLVMALWRIANVAGETLKGGQE